MSRPADAHESAAIALPSPGLQDRGEISPASITSLASMGSAAARVASANTSAALTSPRPSMDAGQRREYRVSTAAADDDAVHHPPPPPATSYLDDPPRTTRTSYPGPYQGYADPSSLSPRGVSMPSADHALPATSPKSPSTTKKHKCPYCATEFTRHHNLKSHLLTHSQEKPYECAQCHSKFRRLHDLKRHTKLHTGERPHTCPICKRKFARGDALARHAKGQGGCAGRRGSQGTDPAHDDDDMDTSHLGDEPMDGIMYTNGVPRGPAEGDMSEDDRRRLSLPSIKAQHVGDGPGGALDGYPPPSRPPSTYPPAGPKPSTTTTSSGGLYPPSSGPAPSTSAASTNLHSSSAATNMEPSAGSMSSANNPILPPGGMTESPKPLSPSGQTGPQLGHDAPSISRQRSPSLTTQFQHAHFGRRQSGRATPPGLSLPSPHAAPGPKLPSLSGLSHPEPRFNLAGHAQMPSNGSSQMPSPSSLYRPSMSSMGEGGNSSNFFVAKSNEREMLNHIQTLEEQVKFLTDKVAQMEQREKIMAARMQEEKMNRLEAENASLRSQLERHHPHASNAARHP